MSATTPQSKFDLTLPTQDNATPPDALTVGELTSLTFTIGSSNYTWPIPAATAVGAAVSVPFSALSPVFAPVAGTSYTAEVLATDASGNGLESAPITWTQAAPVPAAPTGFSVA
jgi:hypothetical protein